MFGTLPIAYRLLGGLVLLGIVFLGGVFAGYSHEHTARITLAAQVTQMGMDQVAANKARATELDRIKKETLDDYQTQLSSNTAYWVKRLRNYSCGSTMSTSAPAASGVNATPTDNVPDYAKLIMDCQATTVQLVTLQKWITKTR